MMKNKKLTYLILLATIAVPSLVQSGEPILCSEEFIDDIKNNREVTIKDKIRLGQEDPNCVDQNGNSALFIATGFTKVESGKALLEKGADPNFVDPTHSLTPLLNVAWYANNKEYPYSYRDNLILAVELIEKGANPLLVGPGGKSPMDMNRVLIEEAMKVVNGRKALLDRAERRVERAETQRKKKLEKDATRISF